MAYIPNSKEDFIRKMAAAGSLYASMNDLPLQAMIACACEESGFGTSKIYLMTGCPFNLQKPAEWKYPQCTIMKIGTVNKAGEKAKPAPFCVANTLEDAGRLWCEWILNWPNKSPRDTLLALRKIPKQFAVNLFLVGFAEGKKANTEKFAKLIDDCKLMEFDTKGVAADTWGL
jgi:hypothetical protein